MVFGDARGSKVVRAHAPTTTSTPAWYRYLQPRVNLVGRKSSPEERPRATNAIGAYFASLIDSPMQDLNLLLFRGSRAARVPNLLANILSGVQTSNSGPVIVGFGRALGTLLDAEARALRHERKHSGTLRRAFFNKIKSNPALRSLSRSSSNIHYVVVTGAVTLANDARLRGVGNRVLREMESSSLFKRQ